MSSAYMKLFRNYPILVEDLKAIIKDKRKFNANDRKQAQGMLDCLLSRRLVLLLPFANDILQTVSVWSLQLQELHGLLYDKLRQRDNLLSQLQEMEVTTTDTSNLRKVLRDIKCWGRTPKVNSEGQLTGEYYIKLTKSPCYEAQFYEAEYAEWHGHQLVSSDLDTELPKLSDIRVSSLQSLSEEIKSYFPDERLLLGVSVLNPDEFPTQLANLPSYSDSSVGNILNMAEELGFDDYLPILAEQWQSFLNALMIGSTQSVYEEDKESGPILFWQKYLSMPSFPVQLKHVINATLVLSVGTAQCERGYSIMNRIKDKYRNLLLNEGLECDMTIHINGPGDVKDVPVGVFSRKWWELGHARADDPILHSRGPTSLAKRKTKKKPDNSMLGESSIYKKRW